MVIRLLLCAGLLALCGCRVLDGFMGGPRMQYAPTTGYVPPSPLPTAPQLHLAQRPMSAVVQPVPQFDVMCPFCYWRGYLIPQKIKVRGTTRFLVGTMHHRLLTFQCPRCGNTFTSPNDKLVPDAAELPKGT